MRTTATTFIICIFFASSVNAGITTRPSNVTSESTAPLPIDLDTELEKISKSCITISDYKLLANNDVTWWIASIIGRELVRESTSTIGLQELRGALHFGPMAPWTKLTRPSDQELASATLEQYYDLKEPKSLGRSLDGLMIMEKDIPRGIAFMDGRFPVIRKMFKGKFEKMMRKEGKMVMDRKMVDRMIEEYREMDKKIRDAIEKTSYNKYCWDRSSLL